MATELETIITFQATNCSDPDSPLNYRFGYYLSNEDMESDTL